nr:uncharacterized protein LOC109151883 [Ipomoea batatas]
MHNILPVLTVLAAHRVVVEGDAATKLRVVAVWWSIWRARNEAVWNGKPWQLSNVVNEIHRNIEAWQSLGNVPLLADSPSHAWQVDDAENADAVKVFVDAAVFSNPECAYYGYVVLNPNGLFVAARNGTLGCMNDVHLAEALAVKEDLLWVKGRGFTKIKLYSDCQTVCCLLNGSGSDWS